MTRPLRIVHGRGRLDKYTSSSLIVLFLPRKRDFPDAPRSAALPGRASLPVR